MNNRIVIEAIEVIRGQLDNLRAKLGERPTDREVRLLAEQFAAMDDDAQAKFFVEVARVMDGWPAGTLGRSGQTYYIGRHLATCACATESGRDLIREIYRAMEGA